MRIVDPANLRIESPFETILTATMPSYVVSAFSNALTDVNQYDTPGPAKIAVVETDAGPTVAIVYHEDRELLEILAPLDDRVLSGVTEVVTVLRIPPTAIEWVHPSLSADALLAGQLAPPRNIVVVEDNPIAQSLLAEVLESSGYAVRLADSWSALLDTLNSWRPEVVLVDLAVPGVEAQDVRQIVDEQLHGVQLVFVGGGEVSIDRALRDESQVVVPLTKNDLLRALSGVTRGAA